MRNNVPDKFAAISYSHSFVPVANPAKCVQVFWRELPVVNEQPATSREKWMVSERERMELPRCVYQ